MSNQHIGLDAEEVIKGRPLQPISKVVVICGEDENGTQIVREAGDDTGRTLEVNIPILSGSASTAQAVADAILAKASGYIYQPFESSNAVIDPRAELGDAVFVGDVYSVLASRSLTFDVISPSDISAPAEAVVDHEFPYGKSPNRTVNRRLAQNEASIRINTENIALSVKDASGNGTTFTVSANGAYFVDAQGNTVAINGGTIQAGTITANQIQAGTITFSNLDAATQAAINAGLTEGEVRTIITDELVSSPNIAGGKFWDLAQNCFLKMHPYVNGGSTLDGFDLLFCSTAHGDSDPLFSIASVDMQVGSQLSSSKYVNFDFMGDTFLSAMNVYGGSPYLVFDTSTFEIYGEFVARNAVIFSSDCYGSSLPSSGSEGQIFFLVS